MIVFMIIVLINKIWKITSDPCAHSASNCENEQTPESVSKQTYLDHPPYLKYDPATWYHLEKESIWERLQILATV